MVNSAQSLVIKVVPESPSSSRLLDISIQVVGNDFRIISKFWVSELSEHEESSHLEIDQDPSLMSMVSKSNTNKSK